MKDLKKHKQDKANVYILKRYYLNQEWRVLVISEIIWFDPGAGVAKHGTVASYFFTPARHRQEFGDPTIEDIGTFTTFDGTYANSHVGVSRHDLDLMEAFWNAGKVQVGAEVMTLREARIEVMERAQRLRDKRQAEYEELKTTDE